MRNSEHAARVVPGVTTRAVPLSVLDLAWVSDGTTTADALEATIEVARAADDLGLHRFWVAEHHNLPSIASTNPPVIMAALAARTEQIRIGSGGVMLPNHAPYVIAEQFALLHALHPGRIDLGIGRAPGTDQVTAAALRRSTDTLSVEDFPLHVLTVMGWLGDRRLDDPAVQRLQATPAPGEGMPEVWLLGSSDYSAQLAARLGLRYCYAHHFGHLDPAMVLDLYRSQFRSSPVLAEPYAMVCTSALAAESSERADFLAGPARVAALGLRSGDRRPLVSPEEAVERGFTDLERDLLDHLPAIKFVGTADEVTAGLDALRTRTDCQELMVTGATYTAADRITSLGLIAAAWQRSPARD